MNENEIFGLALGLAGTPWQVIEVALDPEAGRLDIHLDFPPRSRFVHPEGGEPLGVYDTRDRVWRHLNFFQYECYLWRGQSISVAGSICGGVSQHLHSFVS
jgi:transposase